MFGGCECFEHIPPENAITQERPHMKKHLSSFVFGSLGICAGFTLCFVYVALPLREAGDATPHPTSFSRLALHYGHDGTYFTIPGTQFRLSIGTLRDQASK